MFLRGDIVTDRLLGGEGIVTGVINGAVIVAWKFGSTRLVKPIELMLVEHSVII